MLITAVDTWGYTSQAVVDVNFVSTNVWPRTYSIDWSTVTRISDVAQVVDGMWRIEGNTVRTAETGYDRLINIGDMNVWDSYEVTVPKLTEDQAVDPLLNVGAGFCYLISNKIGIRFDVRYITIFDSEYNIPTLNLTLGLAIDL